MPYKPNDHYARKAKKENFVARSIYKLEEIDQRYKIIRSGDTILDLGASPGSWSQYASRKIGEQGKVLGIDLQPINIQLKNAVFIRANLNDLNVQEIITEYNFNQLFDAVISDMAPGTTGNKFVDQMRSYDLCVLAYDTAKKFLKPKGNFVCKIFEGEDTISFRDELKNSFDEVHIHRPKSTQSSSKEIFLVGLKKKI
ncbi:MAG: RlmE family RNA methyltransferase [Bacteroidia bacterium]